MSAIHRKTRQKEAILKALRDTTCHPTADWLYEQVRREIPNISLGTVYRNLRLLKQEGQILELDLAGSLSRFDANTANHYHFRCEQCGHVFDIDDPVDSKMNQSVASKTGFMVTHHRLEFRGLCVDCQHTGPSAAKAPEKGQF